MKGGSGYEKHEKVFTVVCLLAYDLVCFYFFSTRLGCGAQGPRSSTTKSRGSLKTLFSQGVTGPPSAWTALFMLCIPRTGTTTRIDLKTMKAKNFVPPYAGTFITDDITSDDKGYFYSTGTTPIVGEVYRIDKNGVKTVIAKGFLAPNGIQYNKRTGRLFMSECFQGNRVFELRSHGSQGAETPGQRKRHCSTRRVSALTLIPTI